MEITFDDFGDSLDFQGKLEDFDSGCSSVPSSPSNCSDFSVSSLDNLGEDWTIRREDAIKMGQSILDGGPVVNPFINVKVENDMFENTKNSLIMPDNFSDLLEGPLSSYVQLQDCFNQWMELDENETTETSRDILPENGFNDDKNVTPNKPQNCPPGPTVRRQTRKRTTSEMDHTYANNKQKLNIENLPVKKKNIASDDISEKGEKYWEKRQKNNLAAKRSREIKRRKEIELVKKTCTLEKENSDLSKQVEKLKKLIHKLEHKLLER